MKNLFFFAFLFCLFSCSNSEQKSDKPNIILFFCDDLGYGDLGVYGHPTIKTPNLDRMAGEGLKFTNFYSGSPACTASRYALLTGRYPIRSGFSWVLYPHSSRGIHPDERTLAEGLIEVGYSTACYGKWHLGTTKKEYLPLQNGFDEYFGLPYSNDMIPPRHPEIALMDGNDTLELSPDQTTLTKRYTERAVEFIQKKKWLFGNWKKEEPLKSSKEKIGDLIQEYGDAASIVGGDGIAKVIGKVLGSVDLETLKSRVEKKLSENKKRIVVYIDDIEHICNNIIIKL